MRGYTMNREDYLKRLRRIEGQVRGLQRLIDEDAYCIDVLTQISACTKALQSVAIGLLEEHQGTRLRPVGDQEEVDTLGGLVSSLAGRVPKRGEVIAHPSGIEFEVLDADPRRIKRLRVRSPPAASVGKGAPDA